MADCLPALTCAAAGAASAGISIVYVLVFFALLVAAAVVFALIAQRSFAQAEREAEDQERLLGPSRRREAQRRARSQRCAELGAAIIDTEAQAPGRQDLVEPMRALRRLDAMLLEAEGWERRCMGACSLEVCERAEKLFDIALGQVERARNLGELSASLNGPSSQRIGQRRAQLLAELDATLEAIAAALDQLHASATAGGFQGQAGSRLRDELDARLRIAADVERRMLEIEAEKPLSEPA